MLNALSGSVALRLGAWRNNAPFLFINIGVSIMSYADWVFQAVGESPYPLSSSSVFHILRRHHVYITMRQVINALAQGKREGWLAHDTYLGTYQLKGKQQLCTS